MSLDNFSIKSKKRLYCERDNEKFLTDTFCNGEKGKINMKILSKI